MSVKIIKDTSEKYKRDLEKEKKVNEVRRKKLDEFRNPKRLKFNCKHCGTIFLLDSEDEIKEKACSSYGGMCTSAPYSGYEDRTFEASCPTCQRNCKNYVKLYDYPWICRVFGVFLWLAFD